MTNISQTMCRPGPQPRHRRHNSILAGERQLRRWFFTGDKYFADEDGNLWYAGRSDDMFRVLGEWVSPIEVEAALIEHLTRGDMRRGFPRQLLAVIRTTSEKAVWLAASLRTAASFEEP